MSVEDTVDEYGIADITPSGFRTKVGRHEGQRSRSPCVGVEDAEVGAVADQDTESRIELRTTVSLVSVKPLLVAYMVTQRLRGGGGCDVLPVEAKMKQVRPG